MEFSCKQFLIKTSFSWTNMFNALLSILKPLLYIYRFTLNSGLVFLCTFLHLITITSLKAIDDRLIKFCGGLGLGPRNNWLDFEAVLIRMWIQESFFFVSLCFVHCFFCYHCQIGCFYIFANFFKTCTSVLMEKKPGTCVPWLTITGDTWFGSGG